MLAYMNGVYVQRAICSSFPKGGKYPQKPIGLFNNTKKHELTEKEIQAEREKFLLSLQVMQTNFDLKKK